MDITQEILSRLDAFAEKLGTTTALLWPQRVRAVRIRAIYSLVCCAVCLAMTPVSAYLCWLCIETAIAANRGEAAYGLVSLCLGVVTAAFGVGAFGNGDYFDELLCPEEKALNELLSILRGPK